MTTHLESGIRELVQEFANNGKPCPSLQSIEVRWAGYPANLHQVPTTALR